MDGDYRYLALLPFVGLIDSILALPLLFLYVKIKLTPTTRSSAQELAGLAVPEK